MTRRESYSERGGGLRRIIAFSAVAIVASFALAVPALAEVRPDKTVGVAHNLDLVATSGYNVGDPVEIQVFRNGVQIGEAAGPAAELEGVGLEVNHGTEAAVPGDCWNNVTPDILPGDEVRVNGDGGTDSVVVPNINFDEIDGGPTEIAADDPTRDLLAGDIIFEGNALGADGSSIVSQVSLEMRQGAPRYRAQPDEIRDLGNGEWRAVYRPPFGPENDVQNPNNFSQEQKRAAIANANNEHILAYIPNLQEEYTADLGAEGGPAAGCEGSPREANAIATSDDDFVNINSGDLVLNGTALEGATAVEGTISSSGGGTPVAFSGTATLSNNTTGQKTWTATIPRAQLETLPDGTLTTNTLYTVPDGSGGFEEIGGKELTILKDTVAPDIIADPPSGAAGNGFVDVALSLAAPDQNRQIRYSTDGNPPNENSNLYTGTRVRISDSNTPLIAFATDAAGNRTEESFSYTIRQGTDLTLTTSAAALTFGQPVTLRGNLSSSGEDQANKPVVLEQRRAGSTDPFAPLATVNTDDFGDYSFTATPQRNTQYRARFVEDAGLQGDSAVAQVGVRAVVTQGTPTAALKINRVRVISGRVVPAHAGQVVQLVIRRNGALFRVVNRPLNANSAYAYSFRTARPGVYNVQAVFAGDADHLGNSATRSFRVIR